MMIVVAAGFVISWTPFYLITFISQVQKRSFLRRSNYIFTMLLIHWLGFLNSCFNPIIYNFMNDKFHRSFRQFLNMCRPRWLSDRSASHRWTRVSLTPRNRPPRPYPLARYLRSATKKDSATPDIEALEQKGIELNDIGRNLEPGKTVDFIQRRRSNSPMPSQSSSDRHSRQSSNQFSRNCYHSRF